MGRYIGVRQQLIFLVGRTHQSLKVFCGTKKPFMATKWLLVITNAAHDVIESLYPSHFLQIVAMQIISPIGGLQRQQCGGQGKTSCAAWNFCERPTRFAGLATVRAYFTQKHRGNAGPEH